MDNNAILRSLRFALRLQDEDVMRLFRLGGWELSLEATQARMGREGEPGAVYCVDDALGAFLDGLVLDRRGPPPADRPPPPPVPLTNNEVLKKIRVALELKESDVVTALALADMRLSKGEVRALFRSPAHPNHRQAGDQLLRRFLRGLTLRLRPGVEGPDPGPEGPPARRRGPGRPGGPGSGPGRGGPRGVEPGRRGPQRRASARSRDS